MNKINRENIRKFTLFASLENGELEKVLAYAQVQKVKKNNYIFKEGEHGLGLYILEKGLVKMCHTTLEGKEIVLHLVREGGLFGESSAFQSALLPASAYALKDSNLLFFSSELLEKSILENPHWSLSLLTHISLRMRMFMRKLEARAEKNIVQRLAAYLLHRSKMEEGSLVLELGFSQEVLGGMLGVSRESVSRAIAKLVENNAIEVKAKTIYINDIKMLEEMAMYQIFNL